MATWDDFAAARPDMAAVGAGLIGKTQMSYLATVRRDGSPRVHPVCPVVAGGRLFVLVGPRSPKRFDLRSDGRFALHAMPGPDDAEFYVTGRAREAADESTRALVREGAAREGVNVEPGELPFELDIELVMTAHWKKVGEPGTYAVRQVWRAGQQAKGGR